MVSGGQAAAGNDRRVPGWQLRARAVSHRITWMLGRRFPRSFPFVFVLGFPKSGTTWACQLLADYLQLPFPRYSLLPVGCPAVVHGHEPADARYPKGVYVMRDGRDVMVSRYFFRLRHVPNVSNPPLPRALRRVFGRLDDKNNITANLPRLIEYSARSTRHFENWAVHVGSFLNAKNHHFVPLKYEDLLESGAETLMGVGAALTGGEPDADLACMAMRKFTFGRQQTRPASEKGEKKFLREGRAGDWVNHFTREAAELFDRHFGEILVAAGYETDHSWVSRL